MGDDKEEPDEEEVDLEEFEVADLEPSHWFCHACKAHFGRPVYDPEDETMVYLCPKCGSDEIEDEGS